MNRRDMLLSIAGGVPASLLCKSGFLLGSEGTERTRLGLCIYCLSIRNRAQIVRRTVNLYADPLKMLEVCHRLGAGGVQVPLGIMDEEGASNFRRRAESHEMFVEGIVSLPRDRNDLERFEAEIRTARNAGVDVVRVVMMPGRRYERFDSTPQFRESMKKGVQSLELAEPVAARYRMSLAVENHKGQRIDERLETLEHLSSEYVGMCVDTGNSFALLEDPIEVVEAYAPWAFSIHLKDQAVREYEDGFLFADIPLGDGFFDLVQMVQILRKAKPQIRFSLELITRDPLLVPCLTKKYWATFAKIPGRDLARTLRTVRGNTMEKLPQVSNLPLDEQIEMEEANIKKSLAYASKHLGL